MAIKINELVLRATISKGDGAEGTAGANADYTERGAAEKPVMLSSLNKLNRER